MKRKIQVWHHAGRGELRTIEWNPCGCCPESVISYWGRGFYNSATWYFKNRTRLASWLNSSGWFFLGYL